MRRYRVTSRIKVDEGFDETDPMARAIRSAMPPDRDMDPEARESLLGHLKVMQGRRQPSRRVGPVAWRLAIPALAAVAAVLIALLVVVPLLDPGGVTKPPEKVEPATFSSLTGSVQVLPPGGSWRDAGRSEKLARGWSIRTGEGSRAIVEFADRSIMRMTDGSEARLAALGARSVSVTHVSGGTYHRVRKGTRYSVTNSGVVSSALGTAFNVENRVPGHLEILTVESAVQVSIDEHGPIEVAEGEVITISTDEDLKADKQQVSMERLQDERLKENVAQDADEGYPTGIYENVDVKPAESRTEPEQEATQPEQKPAVQLAGELSGERVALNWSLTGDDFDSLVLLRSEGTQPVYPDHEIAAYSDLSIRSAYDDSVLPGHTYQYRLAAMRDGTGDVDYSNTVVVTVESEQEPTEVSVSLSASGGPAGVDLQWSVSGATRFGGFLLEREVLRAPEGSQTPAGSSTSTRIASGDVFYSYSDETAAAGHTYRYRVGLVMDGMVIVFSDWQTVQL